MSVKIIILRKVPQGKEAAIKPLVMKLRAMCMNNDGYIGGETLINADDPTEFLVISSWKDVGEWNCWLASEDRAKIQQEIDEITGHQTVYQVYYHA
ncbi:MAG: antibiotic biosynthesis monooxygenase [Verrucomicrobia bacterium]|nr:antibiotic biosynthesis monooxygenase [Verrucomicrobiota bacterium]MCH8526126.1 antibiotic biosynthesis monooxygenase [Kiritimatiellia bacterium]